jgi:hypothetical protein
MFCTAAFEFFCNELKSLPGNYLEIGVFNGDSLRELALRFPEKMIYGIDPFIEDGNTTHTTHVAEGQPMPEQRSNALRNIGGLRNVVLWQVESWAYFVVHTDAVLLKLDLSAILVDGSHHYRDAATDLHSSVRALPKGGVLVVDDITLPGVALAMEWFESEWKNRIHVKTIGANNTAVYRILPA